MFEAKVIRSFTWHKRQDKNFKKGRMITDLTKEDVAYLEANGVIAEIVEVGKEEKPVKDKATKAIEKKVEEIVETAEIKPKAEKAVKKTTKKK